MAVVALVGTLDTKGVEYEFLRKIIEKAGVGTLLIDVGVLGEAAVNADIDREKVAKAAGGSLDEARNQPDRGHAISYMSKGVTKILDDLVAEGKIQGVLGLGGTGGTTLITEAMRTLPIGFPKLMVSTVASGDTRPYVGSTDITMMYSIVDIAGINKISSKILANAASAIAGMASAKIEPSAHDEKPVVVASMFGLTTPAVEAAREYLENAGYEVLVFHATGAGGASMESLVDSGLVSGVLDITTTELADELVGGVFASGPTRLTAAGKSGIPQVVSLGALDMVNFGAKETVPARFNDRLFYEHNASVTLMRTSIEECKELGTRIAKRLSENSSAGQTAVFVPAGGFSGIDVAGQAFFDEEADLALITALNENLSPEVEILTYPVDVNDPEFAVEMARRLEEMIRQSKKEKNDNQK